MKIQIFIASTAEIELEYAGSYANQTFNNTHLEADAKQYIEYLKNQRKTLQNIIQLIIIHFKLNGRILMRKRTILLQKFVEHCGLKVERTVSGDVR